MDKNLMKSLCIQTLKQMRLDAQITQAQLAKMLENHKASYLNMKMEIDLWKFQRST